MVFRRSISRAVCLCRGLSAGPELQASTSFSRAQSERVTPTSPTSSGSATDYKLRDHAQEPHSLHQVNGASYPFRSRGALARYPAASECTDGREQVPRHHPLRQCSTASTSPSIPDEEWSLEYSGIVSNTIRTLKMVSIGTAAMSLVGSPLYIMATMDGQYTAVKVMAASGFTLFGLFTTGLLHWFVGPYVHKLWYHAPSEQVKVQVLSVFAQPRVIVFNLSDVQHPEGIAPLQTFQANGRTLFLDEATFDNKDLLEKLTPPSPFDMHPDGSSDKKEPEQ